MGGSRSSWANVVALPRPSEAPPTRLSRVRCAHCAMPVQRGQDSCWSCGLDPGCATAAGHPQAPASAARPPVRRRRSRKLMLTVGLVLVLAAALACMRIVSPGDGGSGVRGLADRLRGEGWQRAGALGASAEFPAPPARRSLPAQAGLLGEGEVLVATAADLRIELLAAPVAPGHAPLDGREAAIDLLVRYAAAVGGRLGPSTAVPGEMAVVDAVLEGAGGAARLRAVAAGSTAYLLAVTGSEEAFERFAASFQLAQVHPAKPLRP